MIRILLLGVFSLIAKTALSQNLQTGFDYLEQGSYIAARDFFSDVLTQYPQDRTARLCYGRALGLSGNAPQAQTIFTTLLQEYPQDFELELNYAEALLWNADYEQAQISYSKLISREPKSFPAVLGYANTLAQRKMYNQARIYIEKALVLQPKNTNALISRKYIRLGKAAQYIQQKDWQAAIALIQQNFENFPKDRESLLNLATIYMTTKAWDLAKDAYAKLECPITRTTGWSLIAHQQHQDKEALTRAKEALSLTTQSTDTATQRLAQERYIQALIWNARYTEAQTTLSQYTINHSEASWLNALKATLAMYRGQFYKGIASYKQILAKDSTSFDGNLGIANAYRALGRTDLAQEYAQKTLRFYPGQQDAQNLAQKLSTEQRTQLTSIANRTTDNGGNSAYAYRIDAQLPLFKTDSAKARKQHLKLGYSYRTTENSNDGTMAQTQAFKLGYQQQLHHTTWLEGEAQLIQAQIMDNDYTELTGKVALRTQPGAKQYLKLAYERQLQDFNAALINSALSLNTYSLSYTLNTNKRLGWYTDYKYTSQTDGNIRSLLFTSVFYQVSKRPGIKTGLNYQYLSFTEQVPQLYFSPDSYHAAEWFGELSGKINNWNYYFNAAIGYQWVAADPASLVYRLEAQLQYSLTNGLNLGLYGKYSNIASATAAGFEYMDFGVRLGWRL